MKSQEFKNIAIGLFFLVLSFSVTFLTVSINNVVVETKEEIFKTTEFARVETEKTRKDIFVYLDNTTDKLDRRVSSIENNTFKRIDSIEKNTFNSVERIETNVDKISEEVILLSKDFRRIPNTIEKFDPYIDCENNDFCWQNLTTDSLISFRNVSVDANKTFLTINENVPKLTEDFTKISESMSTGVPKIVENSGQITENINRLTKPKWYDRLLSLGVNGSLIWFNVNRSMIRNQ